MKFTKTLASVCAAAIAVSSLAVSAFAAPLADKLKNDKWQDPRSYSVKSADITSDDLSAVNKVVFNMNVYDINSGWNNGAVIVKTDATKNNWIQKTFGGTETDKQESKDVVFEKTGAFEVPVEFTPGPNGAFELMVTGVADDAFAVESIALYADAELVGTYGADGYVKASTPEKPKPIQTKADISFTDGKTTPSYTYTVKGDIDALKVDVALSADAAAAGAGWNDYCSAGVAVKNPDGTVKYYQWGGASITWSWDVDGDGVADTGDGVKGETWVGTVGADGGLLSIPVVKGAVVDFYCLSWDTYEGVQYTLTINDEEAAVKPSEPDPADPADPDAPKPIQTKADISFTDGKTPSYTYTVKGDIDALKVDVALSADAAAAQAGWNDWCAAGVAVKNPDGTVKYYQWGGAGVTWSWDANDDKVDDSKDGVKGETWVGTVGADGGQLSIPVVKGAVVDFYCLSWDSYNGVQYTLTINDEEATVKPGEPEDPTKPGETEVPAEPGESSGVVPGDCSGEPVNPPTGAAVAVIPAVLAAAAVATTGIVLKKRSK